MIRKKSVRNNSKEVNQPALPTATTPESPSFPIVGIGASAGGLAAFEAFFSGMPDEKSF